MATDKTLRRKLVGIHPRDFYLVLDGAAMDHKIYVEPQRVQDIEEFEATSGSGKRHTRCNIYTEQGEHVVLHTADEIFEKMIQCQSALIAQKDAMEKQRLKEDAGLAPRVNGPSCGGLQ